MSISVPITVIVRSNHTRVEHTFDTHDYGFIQPGSVNNSFSMLTGYYQSRGLYPSSSSLENEEFEGESSLSNELRDCSDVSANSSPTACDRIATPVIDVRQYLVASTSVFEGVHSISKDMEMWSSSSSSLSPSSSPSCLCTTTSTYSNFTLPSYTDLLDYSPVKVEQPQPTDAILVPRECVNDPKLRCPPEVVITRLPRVEQAVSLQDHSHQPNIDENVDVETYNSP